MLRRLREDAGLRQQTVAEALNVSQAAVSRWERGWNRPSKKYWPMLAELYHVDVSRIEKGMKME